MNLETLQKQNPKFSIRDLQDHTFQPYGQIIEGYDLTKVMQFASKVLIPTTGNSYVASVQELETIPVIKELSQFVYGGLAVQAGTCIGHNKELNGVEYHQGSETLIAIEDCVLILGKRQDMVANTYDGQLTECFYMKKGEVAELYDTTLHYTPCKTGDYFYTIVLLLKGTNETIENQQGILMRKNKWFITHPSIEEKVAAKNYPGLLGDIKKLK